MPPVPTASESDDPEPPHSREGLLGFGRLLKRLGWRRRDRDLDRAGDHGDDETRTGSHGTWTGTQSQIDALSGREMGGPQDKAQVPIDALPQYEFLKWISSGSYGSVWVVRIKATDSIRALKVIHRDGFPHQEAYERELRGLKSYEQFASEHPGLVDILYAEKRDLGEHGPFYFYLMRLAEDISGLPCREEITEEHPGVLPSDYEARTLASELRRKGRIRPRRAVKIAAALGRAVHHLHDNRLVHRDVKPSNILFMGDEPLLADVGLVTQEGGDHSRMGSLAYVPPEGSGSPTADIFALGKVLFQMVTGAAPDQYPFLPERFERRLEANRQDRKFWETILPIIDRSLDPNPEERYADGGAFAEALDDIVREPPKRWPRVALAAAGVVTLALGIFGIWEYKSFSSRPADLVLTVVPDDATVTIGDTKLIGGLVHLSGIPPGEVSVTVEHANYHGASRTVNLKAGTSTDLGLMELKSATGGFELSSRPPGAVVSLSGERLGMTPLEYGSLRPGSYKIELSMSGFRRMSKEFDIKEGKVADLGELPLRFYSPPRAQEEWENSLGVKFPPRGSYHVARNPITRDELGNYARAGYLPQLDEIPIVSLREIEGFSSTDLEDADVIQEEGDLPIAMLTTREVEGFASWLEELDRESGFFDRQDTYAWRGLALAADGNVTSAGGSPSERSPYILTATKRTRVHVALRTSPAGAEIWLGGRLEGSTKPNRPFEISRGIRLGAPLICRKFGYRDHLYEGELLEFGTNQLHLKLVPWWGGNPGAATPPNSLGMRLAPLGDQFWSVWEVRVRDMDAFCEATGRDPLHRAVFEQGGDHPAVNVTLQDAIDFCAWLTERERKLGQLPLNIEYRLPTDVEWSRAAGIAEPAGLTITARDAMAERKDAYPVLFPWGNEWPPPAGTGNYNFDGEYADDFPFTAPAGSFKPNKNGLYGTSGGVWEWVSDPYPRGEGSVPLHVCRGGAYNNNRKKELLAGRRNLVDPGFRDVLYGFRPVLAVVAPVAVEAPPPAEDREEPTAGSTALAE